MIGVHIHFPEKQTTQMRKIIIIIFINSEKLGRQIRKPIDKITVALKIIFNLVLKSCENILMTKWQQQKSIFETYF